MTSKINRKILPKINGKISRKIPHGGFHGSLFEGWYYRVILPEANQSFAFMYAIAAPQNQGNNSKSKNSGGSVQVFGVGDQYLWRTLPNFQDFYGDSDRLALSHYNQNHEGYSASDCHNQGRIYDPSKNITCTWNYKIQSADIRPVATMGWLSYLPIFEPGWQILMSLGWGSGFVKWGDHTYEFQNAPVYMEKNWGRAFPGQWFWIQCNAFDHIPNLSYQNLSLVCAGGNRETLGISSAVAMINIYLNGELFSFMPDNSEIYCAIAPWGNWEIRGYVNSNGKSNHKKIRAEITAETDDPGTMVMVPTESGMQPWARDTAVGKIKLVLYIGDRRIYAQSNLAALEIGGNPTIWQEYSQNLDSQNWHFKSAQI